MNRPQPKADLAEIRRALSVFFQPGDVVELRALDVGGMTNNTHGGYFSDFGKLANEAARLSGQAAGVYPVLNEINPDLLARSANRITVRPKNLTQDTDVTRRRWLPIDADAKRAPGISSTDAEHEAALATAKGVKGYLVEHGFPQDSILTGDSGNGAHVLARVDLPNDAETKTLVESCIKAIAAKFDSDKVTIDRAVFNAARIWKLPGTLACKGDSTADRPHRIARLLDIPATMTVAPIEALKALAATAPAEAPKTMPKTYRGGSEPFDLAAWLARNNVRVKSSGPYEGRTRYILEACPFNPEHTGTSVAVFEGADGKLGFKCQHSSCADKTWADLRRLKEPGYKDRRDAGYEQTTERRVKGNAEGEVKGSSFLALDHNLYEQIISDGEAAFIEYDTTSGESREVTHVMQGDVKVIPLSGEEIVLGAVKLPSGIAEYGSTLSLLREIESHIYRYLDVSDSFRKFAAYYVLLSWLYDRFNTLPYLRFIGDTGCGKSRALDVCGGLCYKSTSASGCVTPAPIYRMLKRWAGTIILDEADLQNSDEYHEVTKILNCGFERNRPVIRAVKDNPDKLQILPTFGPKVFATRRRFKDAALEARCLTEIMQETTRDDIPATLTTAFHNEQQTLRDKLLLFRLKNYGHINRDDTVMLDLHGIEPRLRQISACFASLFAGQPDVLSDYRAFIGKHQRELVEQRAATTIGQVVEKLFFLMESVTNVTNVTNDTTLIPVSSGDIAGALNMTPQAVGQILKTLGLETRLHKLGSGPKRCIIFNQAKLDTLRKRYVPREDEEPVSMVTMVTTHRDSTENVTGDDKGIPWERV